MITPNTSTATDMIYEESVAYTYFCDGNNNRTWIDHVLSTEADNNHVSNCAIIPRQPTNSSDHLPIRVELLMKGLS